MYASACQVKQQTLCSYIICTVYYNIQYTDKQTSTPPAFHVSQCRALSLWPADNRQRLPAYVSYIRTDRLLVSITGLISSRVPLLLVILLWVVLLIIDLAAVSVIYVNGSGNIR